MDQLNDDCIMEIFIYLTALERIKVERVCKRWKFLSRKSWNKLKAIDDHLMKLISRNKFLKDDFSIAFDAVLSRCQKYFKIVEVDLSSVKCEQIFALFNGLVEYSRNLELLAFTKTDLYGDIDEMFRYLFLQNRKLKSLVLPTAKITGECLMALDPKNLTEIHLLVDSEFIKVDLLQRAFSSFVNLKILALEAELSYIKLVLSEVTAKECKIQELQILRTFDEQDSEQPNYPAYFLKMKNLVELCLSYVTLNKYSFKAIDAASLTSLLLIGFNTDDYSDFLFFLKSCNNLKTFHLGIDMRNCIKNDVFVSLSECKKLYHVHLINCINISNEGVAELANLPDLRILQIDRSRGVTAEYIGKKFKHVKEISINGTIVISSA